MANFDGSASLSCSDCHDKFICPVCFEIDICLNDHTSILIYCDAGVDDVVSSKLMDSYTKADGKSSTLFDDLYTEFPKLVNFVGVVGCSFCTNDIICSTYKEIDDSLRKDNNALAGLTTKVAGVSTIVPSTDGPSHEQLMEMVDYDSLEHDAQFQDIDKMQSVLN